MREIIKQTLTEKGIILTDQDCDLLIERWKLIQQLKNGLKTEETDIGLVFNAGSDVYE
ncbi:hypothetical protein [Lentibacillus salinarum]|uniref:Fur-regulated basic protein FbpA n=1 Tax=Lentibacillus salinarum TaxID=446820 RepID=A0ABW3ZTQ4_9BACI